MDIINYIILLKFYLNFSNYTLHINIDILYIIIIVFYEHVLFLYVYYYVNMFLLKYKYYLQDKRLSLGIRGHDYIYIINKHRKQTYLYQYLQSYTIYK